MMHVYVMTSEDGPVKVGVSSFPECRLKQIKREGYGYCRLHGDTIPHPKARRIESIAHELLSGFRLRGEWFRVDPDDAVKAVEQAFEMVESGIEPVSKCQRQRAYTPDELREILELLYGPGTDWHLAKKASGPDQFNIDQRTILRWLKGPGPITGTAAAVAYVLSK